MPKPTFLIIGAQKCGTDALYHALQQHPDIGMSPNKEPFFFLMNGRLPDYRLPGPRYTNRLVYDWDAYLQLFAGAAGKRAIGEASAIYLSSYFPEKTAARIRDRIPAAKLIALVRQPAERAYSAYNFYRARDFEPLASFAEALAADGRWLDRQFCDVHSHAPTQPWPASGPAVVGGGDPHGGGEWIASANPASKCTLEQAMSLIMSTCHWVVPIERAAVA